jgi:hypothetical protein
MKQPPRPAYWQLDVFVLLMIGLLMLVMLARLSPGWETMADIAWAVLTVAGMGVWVRLNWAALLHEEREQRMSAMRRASRGHDTPARTLPLTPVQQQFLAVMEQTERDDSSGARN